MTADTTSRPTPSTPTSLETPAIMESSRLLNLPPELRNRIYDLVFTTERRIIVRQHHKGSEVHAFISADNGTEAPAKCHSLALLRTCKQVNQEAAQISWACNDFQIMAGYTCSRDPGHGLKFDLSCLYVLLGKAQRQGAKVFGDIVFSLGQITYRDAYISLRRDHILEAFKQLRALHTGAPGMHLKVDVDLVIRLNYSDKEVDTISQKVSFDGLANSATTLQAAIAELRAQANKLYHGKRPSGTDLEVFTALLQELQSDLGCGPGRSLRRRGQLGG
ncbi:hypothetical protein LTR56_009435 [Elasticomyces elasticus]|nr:hypothetical protein LTR56_009435 [Elasticomyces elasticus]KAK3645867.1 hypothetical protein LTR22_014533 [Elasticomyces elasticus]